MKVSVVKARDLRKNFTDAERLLWHHLRLRQINGYRFCRQRPEGPYILDFGCLEKRIVVEVDGGQHSEQLARDGQRDAWLRERGYVILGFWNHEVLTQIEGVKESISRALNETPSFLLPRVAGKDKPARRPFATTARK